MKKAIIIDGNSIAYAAQNSRPLKTGAGDPVQAVFGTLRTLKRIREDSPQAKIVVLWDSPKDWRSAEYPEYKGNRETTQELKDMRAELRSQRPSIVRGIFYLGIDQLAADGFEADDLAWVLAERFMKRGLKVEFQSGDRDWIQLVTEDSTWIDPIKNRKVSAENFQSFTQCDHWHQFVHLKALAGDKSDNLDGIPGIGEKTAVDIVNHFGSVARLLSHYDKHGDFQPKSMPTPTLNRARNKVNAFCGSEVLREVFFFNLRMMDLRNAPKPTKDKLKITKGNKNMSKFTEFCEDRQFNTILKSLSSWDAIF